MIGKIKKFNFESLFILNTFALIVTSYFFNNFIFTGVYVLFFFISIFTTKNGLKIIKKFNLLQNIRNEGPANHFKKSDTPTMGGIFMIIPFLILLLIITINLGSLKLILLLLTIFGFFITGFLDDYLSIKKRENKEKYKYLSFLPGSRQNEVLKLIKYFSYIEKYISKNNLNYKIFIPTLPHLVSLIKENTKQWKTETIISTDMSKFDEYYEDVYISITCSGTASLEIAKRNIPQIVIYKLNYFTEILIKPFVRVKYANLINIISNRMIIPEVVNSNLNEKKLLNIFLNLFNDRKKQETQINSINMHLKEIVNDFSPYDVSVNRINKLINLSSKAN